MRNSVTHMRNSVSSHEQFQDSHEEFQDSHEQFHDSHEEFCELTWGIPWLTRGIPCPWADTTHAGSCNLEICTHWGGWELFHQNFTRWGHYHLLPTRQGSAKSRHPSSFFFSARLRKLFLVFLPVKAYQQPCMQTAITVRIKDFSWVLILSQRIFSGWELVRFSEYNNI